MILRWKTAAFGYHLILVCRRLVRVCICRSTQVLSDCAPIDCRSIGSAAMSKTSSLEQLPRVEIDNGGCFKYVLIRLHRDGASQADDQCSDLYVRGHSWAGYHVDLYERFSEQASSEGVETECLGGGRIRYDVDSSPPSMLVYGYSVGFGQADHQITASLVQKQFPDLKITTSNEGY